MTKHQLATMPIVDLDGSSREQWKPSDIGRTFNKQTACYRYCRAQGYTTMARIKFDSGTFYAPYLRIELAPVVAAR